MKSTKDCAQLLQNVKLIGEYRHRGSEDKASIPNTARLKDDGLTVRAMFGF